MIQAILHNLYVSVKLTSLHCGLRIILVYPYSSLKRVVENLGALLCCCNNKKEERVRSNFALSQALIATFAPKKYVMT